MQKSKNIKKERKNSQIMKRSISIICKMCDIENKIYLLEMKAIESISSKINTTTICL
jgi:hypothetical protein